MADLSEVQAAQAVKIIGSSTAGVESTPVASTLNGAMHVNLQNGSGSELLKRQLPSNSIPVIHAESPTFIASAQATAIANNKSMLSLLNASGSGVVLRLNRIYIRSTQLTAVSGVLSIFQLLRITGHTGGTLVTPNTFDTNDTLNGSVTARTGSTVSGEGAVLQRWVMTSDELDILGLRTPGVEHSFGQHVAVFQVLPGQKPLVLRPGEGAHIKHVINSTAGTFDIVFEFTQEPV